MASATEVKTYLAYWFQLGKKLIWCNDEAELSPQPIIQGDLFSPEFEDCWQRIISVDGKDIYLEGCSETIEELLSPTWDISNCARCDMPVPIIEMGIQPLDCVCSDLENWPNSELPAPRSPVNNRSQLNKIKTRLEAK